MLRMGFALIGMLVATAAVAQTPSRPAEDVARDALRKPAEMVTFAHIRAGAKVADMIPGTGYFTRVFAGAVGSTGTVYALVPATLIARYPKALTTMQTLAAEPGYGNVKVLAWSGAQFPPERLDVVWTAQNYHDLHNGAPGTVEGVNKAVFAQLKPGGIYVVLDHAAMAGSGARDTSTLHRIDPAVVKAEVTAAGFVFDGEDKTLANPADPHTANVFDPSIRGHTDQFIYRFRKP